MDEQRTWIIAGNVRQARDWAHANGMQQSKCFWVASTDDLRGVSFGKGASPSLVWTGTYWDRPDYRELLAEVEFRGGPLPHGEPPRPPLTDAQIRLLVEKQTKSLEVPPLSPEILKMLLGEEKPKPFPAAEGVVGPPGEPIPVPIPYQQIATCIAETVLDPDERTALVERLIEVFVAHDPMFQKRRFRGAADG